MMLINENFRNLIPPLTESEYSELEQSILTEGCREPLTVWNNMIVDGHHRFEICQKYNIPFETKEINFETEDDAKIWIITNQLARRNISDFTRIELALKRKEILLAMGREKQKQTLKQYRDTVLLQDNKTDEEPHNTRNILATEIKISPGYIAKAEQIIKQAPEELLDKLRKGDISISKAYEEIKKQQREAEIEEIREQIEANQFEPPTEKFDVIVIDPPWPYGTKYDANGRRAASPYPEMQIDEIKAINLPSADDCILWLWTTHKFMREAFGVLDAWGFRDVAILTWVKDRMGLGSWLRSQSEFCIMAVKGNPKVNLTNQTTVLYGKMREHSRKPDEFYQMVDELCNGRKIDWFSREKREGWFQFGAESERF